MKETIIGLVGVLVASNGFWGYLTWKQQYKKNKDNALLVILHDRLWALANFYIKRHLEKGERYLSLSEYNNIRKIYNAYVELGGNDDGEELYKLAVDNTRKIPNNIVR